MDLDIFNDITEFWLLSAVVGLIFRLLKDAAERV